MKSAKSSKLFKALITDVDGTLIPNKKEGMPSPRIKEAIKKAKKHLHVGVATSRPLFMLTEIFKYLEFSGPSIINAGSQVIDVKTKKILWEQPILLSDVPKIFAILNKFKRKVWVHDYDKDIELSQSYVPKKPLNVYMFGLFQDKVKEVTQLLSNIPTIAAHPTPDWSFGKVGISISHISATKQHGIFELAKILKINTHDIIGVGDGGNDFPLLMACGLKVAMGNADENLKAIADYVAPTVDEDGLADVIEKFVLH